MANLRSWKNKLQAALNYPWDSNINTDHPDCPRCGCAMDFYGHDESGDFPIGEGYWECSSCGFKITEDEL